MRKPKPNPYRIETETGPAGREFPHMVVFTRPPDRATLDAMVAAHPLIEVRRHQSMDPAGCVFQCAVKQVDARPFAVDRQRVAEVEAKRKAAPAQAAPAPRDQSTDPPVYTARIQLSLHPDTKRLLVEKARQQGLKPATLGRLLIQNGVGG